MVRQQNLSSTVETAAAAGVEPNAAGAPRLAASLRTSLMRRFTLTVALALVCALMIGTVLLLNTSHEATERKTAHARQHVTQNLDRIEKRWRAEALVYASQLTLARVLVNADPTLLRARFTAFATSLGGSATFTQALLYDAQGRLLASYRTRSGAAADQVQPANIAAAWWFDRPDQTLYRIVRVPLLVNGERAQLHLYAPFDAALLETLAVPGIDLYPKWQTQSLPNLSAMPQDSMGQEDLLAAIFVRRPASNATVVWPGEASGLVLELRTQLIWVQPWRSRMTFIGIAIGFILLLGWFILGRWIVREVVVPVDDIARVAQLVAQGGLGERASVNGPAELQTVALEFNRMLDARVASELALSRSEALASAVLDASIDSIVVLDSEGRIVAVNQVWVRFGQQNGAIGLALAGPAATSTGSDVLVGGRFCESSFGKAWIGTNYLDVTRAAASDPGNDGTATQIIDGISAVLQGRLARFDIEYPCNSPQEERWFRMSAVPMGAGFEGGAVIFHQDITEQLRLEGVLREAQKMAAIGTIAGGIAHDFNNIITAILGNAKIASEDAENDPRSVQLSVEEIRKAAVRARNLVQQIMVYSGRQTTQRKPTALNFVIDQSVRKLSATLPPQIVIEVHSAADVPQVLGDETQIQQVIINLATNAIQALSGRSGRIDIRLDKVILAEERAARPQFAAWHKAQQCEVVRLMIRDDGTGMDAATLEKIFDPFFTTRPMGEGKGMGLSVVQGVVATHEGTIIVESQVSKGTTFIIYLPAVAEHANASVEPDAAASQ
jgi:signal transduction histidine kinase